MSVPRHLWLSVNTCHLRCTERLQMVCPHRMQRSWYGLYALVDRRCCLVVVRVTSTAVPCTLSCNCLVPAGVMFGAVLLTERVNSLSACRLSIAGEMLLAKCTCHRCRSGLEPFLPIWCAEPVGIYQSRLDFLVWEGNKQICRTNECAAAWRMSSVDEDIRQ